MKKSFPVIIILTTLSLLGIIYIQFSWIRTLALSREEQFEQTLSIVVQQVGEELVEEAGESASETGTEMQLLIPGDVKDLYSRYSVSNHFTEFEVREKIKKAFVSHNIRIRQFEFAITSNEVFGRYSLRSAHFADMSVDTLHNLFTWYPLGASSGSDMENLTEEEYLVIVVPDIKSVVLQSLDGMIAIAVIFTLIILIAFYLTFRTLLRQKKLSEMKNDFINNMTHELKTPLSTISIAVDTIRNEKVLNNREMILSYAEKIKEENKRILRYVEDILQSAQMDNIKLKCKPVHAHEMIRKVLSNLYLQVEEKKGTVDLSLQASNDLMEADEKYFPVLLSNLIENAIKYSKEDSLFIRISTCMVGRSALRIQIEDNGIGMTKETMSKIFEKFYRAHTGNVHNVKGFGLGLSNVKTITKAHNGKISVDSVLGKGSTFTLEFPVVMQDS